MKTCHAEARSIIELYGRPHTLLQVISSDKDSETSTQSRPEYIFSGLWTQ